VAVCTQHTPEMTVYAPSGIRARDPSTQAAAALLTERRSSRSVHVRPTLLTPHAVLHEWLRCHPHMWYRERWDYQNGLARPVSLSGNTDMRRLMTEIRF